MIGSELLSIQNLSAWYNINKPILKKISLDLKRNEVVGLIGLNGAGKTTFIKTIAGLLSGYSMDSATWSGCSFSFRDNEFKKQRYIVFTEDRSFVFHILGIFGLCEYGIQNFTARYFRSSERISF